MSPHGLHLGLLAVALVGSIPYGWSATASLALGGGIQVLNLRVLQRSVRLMVASTVELGSGAQLAVYAAASVRFVLLLVVVAWALIATPVEPLPFGIGLTLVVPALLAYGFSQVRRASATDGRRTRLVR